MQTPEETFRKHLEIQTRPYRFTRQQQQLVRWIFTLPDSFDADWLCENIRAAGLPVSRATIFRTLPKLVDAGLLIKADQSLYLRND